MSSSCNSDDNIASSSSNSSKGEVEKDDEEEELEDVIVNPQNEDDVEDNRVFRKYKWDRDDYEFIINPIKKSGFPDRYCTPYFWSRSQETKQFDISGGEMDDLNLAKLSDEYKNIDENEEICTRIGKHCIMNKRIKYLHAELWTLDEEGIRGFFRHWEGEQSQLLGLELCAPNMGDDGRLGGVGMREILERFLRNNTTLQELHLNFTQLKLDNARDLVGTLSNNRLPPLVHVGLAKNKFGDDGAQLLSTALSHIPTIKTVNLAEYSITRYSSIVSLLRNSTCCLTKLDLETNNIDDDFLSEMATDIADNTYLHKVILSNNSKITEDGWESLLQIVVNSSDLTSLVSSNHHFASIGSHMRYGEDISNMQGVICQELRRALGINHSDRSLWDKIRWKIFSRCFSSPVLSLYNELLGIDTRLMPLILSMVVNRQKYHPITLKQTEPYSQTVVPFPRLQVLYQLARDLPSLFEFPSPEKRRMLENEQSQMRRKDKIIDKLRLKIEGKDGIIEGLRRDIDELKRERDSVGGKRLRVE